MANAVQTGTVGPPSSSVSQVHQRPLSALLHFHCIPEDEAPPSPLWETIRQSKADSQSVAKTTTTAGAGNARSVPFPHMNVEDRPFVSKATLSAGPR